MQQYPAPGGALHEIWNCPPTWALILTWTSANVNRRRAAARPQGRHHRRARASAALAMQPDELPLSDGWVRPCRAGGEAKPRSRMEILAPVTLDEVVAVWLGAEIHRGRFGAQCAGCFDPAVTWRHS